MQYAFTTALLALAIGGHAAPQFNFPPSGGWGPAPGVAAPGTGVGFATATSGVAYPTGTGLSSVSEKAAADDGEDEEEEEESSSDEEEESSDDEEEESSGEEEESSDDDSDSSATATASSSGSDETEAASSSSASSAGTTEAASGSSGSASSGGSIPASSGSSALSAVQTIAAGESFDGGMVMFDRGVDCSGQSEGGDSDAVFEIENGGSISNVIIGPNQVEGIHCFGSCTLTNVWWTAVCEDAFTIKEQGDGETTTITGGGAEGAVCKQKFRTLDEDMLTTFCRMTRFSSTTAAAPCPSLASPSPTLASSTVLAATAMRCLSATSSWTTSRPAVVTSWRVSTPTTATLPPLPTSRLPAWRPSAKSSRATTLAMSHPRSAPALASTASTPSRTSPRPKWRLQKVVNFNGVLDERPTSITIIFDVGIAMAY